MEGIHRFDQGCLQGDELFDGLATGLHSRRQISIGRKKNQKQGFSPCPYPLVRFG